MDDRHKMPVLHSTEHAPKPKAVVICSGGLDSTVLLYKVMRDGYEPYVLSVDYGQRHSIELHFIAKLCAQLELDHEIVDLTPLQRLLKSSLTFQGEVPHGHYSAENMKATVVPNRNAIMLSIAYGWARSLDAGAVFIGAHAGDHPIYPDCRAEFFQEIAVAFNLGSGYPVKTDLLKIRAPFVNIDKTAIVLIGAELRVPFEFTWSCYEGALDEPGVPLSSLQHCGRCGTCVERAEAFYKARITDPTLYKDPDFWRTVVGGTHG